jgi:predicted phosphodiesterase
MISCFKRALVLSDIHVPWQNKNLLQNIFKLIAKENFDEIILNGDTLDMYSISKWPSEPSRVDQIQDEIDEASELLAKIRRLSKKSKIVFIKGNHCERLEKFLTSKAKALSKLRCLYLPELLQLSKHDIRYEERHYFIMPKLLIYHGSKTAKLSSKAELESNGISGISGHTHRYNYYQSKNILGETFEWYSMGHLADASQLGMSYSKTFSHHWDNSFCVVNFNNKVFDVQVIRASNDSFFYNGEFYEKNKR